MGENNKFFVMCEELTNSIKTTYEESVSIEEAEKLAAKFLHAQLMVASELKTADLDARMRKSGLKALKAAVYLDNASKGDKKPSDKLLEAVVDSDEMVNKELSAFDFAEVRRNELENYLNVFREAHIFYRGVSKGRFD